VADGTFRVGVQLDGLEAIAGMPFDKGVLPTLAYAVESLAQAAHARWRDFANGAPLPNGRVLRNRTGEYLRSILVRQTGDFAAEVYSELPYAYAIEYGSPARDMKKMLDSSLKVRLTKDGRRYLIIPIRHDHPNSVMGNNLPVAVHRWLLREDFAPSSVTSEFQRVSQTGAYHWRDGINPITGTMAKKGDRVFVKGWRYQWGSRLSAGDLAGMGFGPETKTSKRLRGLVNFRNPGGSGGGAHSQLLTFRVMMQGSSGWIMPAREGMYPARSTADEIRPEAETLFRAAVQHDIQRILAPGD